MNVNEANRNSELEIAAASIAEASDIVMLADMAGQGLPAYFWADAEDRVAGTSLLQIGRERVRRDHGDFSWRNARLARLGGQVAGMHLGYRQPDELTLPHLPNLPALVRPLVELESLAPGSWYLNMMSVYPEFRGHGIGKALLEHAFQLALETDARDVSLIVEDANETARRLYERTGFNARASRDFIPFSGGPEAKNWILMVRDLH